MAAKLDERDDVERAGASRPRRADSIDDHDVPLAGHDVPLADIHLTDLPHTAGGLGAIWSSMRYVQRDAGLVRGTKALLAMNQVGGFDCPGCAWPEPDAGHRDRF